MWRNRCCGSDCGENISAQRLQYCSNTLCYAMLAANDKVISSRPFSECVGRLMIILLRHMLIGYGAYLRVLHGLVCRRRCTAVEMFGRATFSSTAAYNASRRVAESKISGMMRDPSVTYFLRVGSTSHGKSRACDCSLADLKGATRSETILSDK